MRFDGKDSTAAVNMGECSLRAFHGSFEELRGLPVTIEELINIKLDEIEEKEQVKILHAVESGSRAWGFASPDSDYDVRFIYVRKREDYLRLEERKDFIDWELGEVLDINGWDLQKALRLFHKSNATLFEWANSPVVYRTTTAWSEIYEAASTCFSLKACMYQYYGTAKSNYQEFLLDDTVKYKKYFYVIRPLLACQWMEERHCPPPVAFDALSGAMLKGRMKALVDRLLKLKTGMKEADRGPRMDEINGFLEERIAYYKETIVGYEDDRIKDWEILNQIFLNQIIGEDCPLP